MATKKDMQSVSPSTLDFYRDIARCADNTSFLAENRASVEQAMLIREVEVAFLDLFSQGLMNGTVHTCIGQEFSAVAVAGGLETGDWVTSNHRCHGHFIAKTGEWKALVDELMGLKSGVCKGVGSSQHLYAEGFLSNGPQGALLPVGSGIAMHFKQSDQTNIVTSFIGEGTLGEGVVYESFNLASLWSLPQLFVCENNFYSQSTPQSNGIAGDIIGRAEAFGLKVFQANTWQLQELFDTAEAAMRYVREECRPAFLLLGTYRLKAHSKGDDDRDADEIAYFEQWDTLNRLSKGCPELQTTQTQLIATIAGHINDVDRSVLSADEYGTDQLPRHGGARSAEVRNERLRMVQAINRGLEGTLQNGGILVGEDIADPYGGAFKASKGLSDKFPTQVLSSPISEAGIAGLGTGLALMGKETYVEIMFGDFMTNIVDQLINNMAKFHHMYAFQATVPVRVRTPMGGKRGYGPTHSQSLEKHLLGIDNVLVLAPTSLEDPRAIYQDLQAYPAPAVLIESKTDYGQLLWQDNPNFRLRKLSGDYGTLVLTPARRKPTLTLVAYGGTARELANNLEQLFIDTDYVAELIVPIRLHPLDMSPILRAASKTSELVVVEDGSCPFGFGSEVLAQVAQSDLIVKASRIGAEPVPIPSPLALEHEILPSYETIVRELTRIRCARNGPYIQKGGTEQ
ncbi:MAG: thiamine pyrophosphate-dependent enzyme [Pseudomonadota bacterium]|nr:thiamine pyrophosphate-dependent enzyme [Pseudomonadota bacterium]